MSWQIFKKFCLLSPCVHPWELRLEYARSKQIYWTIEQPATSLLPYYAPFQVGLLVCIVSFYMSKHVSLGPCTVRNSSKDTRLRSSQSLWGIGWRHKATCLQTNLHVCLVSLHASNCLAFEIDQFDRLERYSRKSTILITTAPFLKELASTVLTAERRLEFKQFLGICLSNLCKSY